VGATTPQFQNCEIVCSKHSLLRPQHLGENIPKGFKVYRHLSLMFASAKMDLKSNDMRDPGILFWKCYISVSLNGIKCVSWKSTIWILFQYKISHLQNNDKRIKANEDQAF